MEEYSNGEGKVDTQTLVARVQEMIGNEPGNATHLCNYAVLMSRTGKKKTREEMEPYWEAVYKADKNFIRGYTAHASYLASIGDQQGAGEKYLEGYHIVYRQGGGGHMLGNDEVVHLMLLACHKEETGFPQLPPSVTVGSIYKDAALQAPQNAMAQGNYGLYLARNGDNAGALPRLQTAAAGGDDFWVERLEEFQAAQR